MNKEVYIVSALRTPIGSFNGQFSSLSAIKLGATAIQGAIQKAGISAGEIDEVYMGNVVSAGLGQAPARQAAHDAGIPHHVPCTAINKVCASGAKSIMIGAQSIMLGHADVVVAGGMESMSNIPYYVDKARFGYKLGHGTLTDGLLKDGLWDGFYDKHVGSAAENTAREMQISRSAQDEYAIRSYKRAAEAAQAGYFKDEIVPVEILQRGKTPLLITEDEEYTKVNFEKIPSLNPVFEKEGTITAANASTINDGAAALILMSKEKVEQTGVKPLARVLGFADAEQDPLWFTTSPSLAIPLALRRAGITSSDVDFYEINEAFSVVAIANNTKLGIDPETCNVFGGAVSLGHPLGCSGARIMVTLLNVLDKKKGKIGVTGICNGGGGASAVVVENLQS